MHIQYWPLSAAARIITKILVLYQTPTCARRATIKLAFGLQVKPLVWAADFPLFDNPWLVLVCNS